MAAPSAMPPLAATTSFSRIRRVGSFQELATARFEAGVNALCWERSLAGDFGEVVARLGDESPAVGAHLGAPSGVMDQGAASCAPTLTGEGIVLVDEAQLRDLAVSARGKVAVAVILEDLRRLRELDRDPVLNCIHGYPRDEEPGPVVTDVFSWHADSAPVEADTWLCTYHGSPSEGLRNEDVRRRVDLPETRAELLKLYGGADDAGFRDFLHEHCYDLHYAPAPGAQPYSFGVGNLWRIAVDWPGSPVPPCVHRAPATIPGEPRLMVIC